MFKIAFIVSMCVTGITEWLKKLLPAKVNENKVVMAAIAGALGVVSAAVVAFVPGLVSVFAETGLVAKLLFVGSVVALTQTSYTLLFQTLKAVKTALTKKVTIDPDSLAEEIAGKVVEEADKITKK